MCKLTYIEKKKKKVWCGDKLNFVRKKLNVVQYRVTNNCPDVTNLPFNFQNIQVHTQSK